MPNTIPSALLQEVHDLLSISTVSPELKAVIENQLQSGNMKPHIFQQLLALLREEDRLDKDIQKYSKEIINFDPNQYIDHVQEVVNNEVQQYLKGVQM